MSEVTKMKDEIKEVDLRKIRPNRFNPRLDIDTEELRMLTESIKEKGLLQPIIVRPVNDYFEVVVGERRYRTAQKAGLEFVPVIIRHYSDADVIELSLVENIQRTDLSAVEKGNSCKQLMERYPDKFPTRAETVVDVPLCKPTVST
jgi:ParB family chromosome partitioning protein